MKFLILLFCLAVAQSHVIKQSILPSPDLMTAYNNEGLVYAWSKVTSDDPREPVIGYKFTLVTETPKMVTQETKVTTETRYQVPGTFPLEHDTKFTMSLQAITSYRESDKVISTISVPGTANPAAAPGHIVMF